ncbi:MAG TPA: M15 family metallopeptidase [Deltaproteobacteria bacterium]|nr:M15 family metallopeptidase [Deltaproteobacteria bacterium]
MSFKLRNPGRISFGKFSLQWLAICGSLLLFTVSAVGQGLPEGFVYVDEHIPNMVVELRYYSKDNFMGRPAKGYRSPRCILTEEATNALKKVQEELEKFGLGIKIFDAYRPQRAVNHFVQWAKDLSDTLMKAKYYPEVEKRGLFKKGYIADKSSHSRGSTVDLTLVNKAPGEKPQELDMGTGFDFFSPQSWPTYLLISAQARAHRMLLQRIMVENGFTPYFAEWWHFTLKNEPFPDQYFDFPIQ